MIIFKLDFFHFIGFIHAAIIIDFDAMGNTDNLKPRTDVHPSWAVLLSSSPSPGSREVKCFMKSS